MREGNPAGGRGRRRRRSAAFWPLVMIAVFCAAILFTFSAFRVTEIIVEGAQAHSYDEVVRSSGIEPGDNLFFIDRSGASSKIFSQLSYVESVNVTRKFPDTVVISIFEAGAAAYVTTEGGTWTIDRNCKVLQRTTQVSGLIRLSGLAPLLPIQGETMKSEDGEEGKTELAAAVMSALAAYGISGRVSEIDVSDISCAVIRYDERFTARLGSVEDIERKVGLVKSAVSQLAAGDSGILDLTLDEKVHYIPD